MYDPLSGFTTRELGESGRRRTNLKKKARDHIPLHAHLTSAASASWLRVRVRRRRTIWSFQRGLQPTHQLRPAATLELPALTTRGGCSALRRPRPPHASGPGDAARFRRAVGVLQPRQPGRPAATLELAQLPPLLRLVESANIGSLRVAFDGIAGKAGKAEVGHGTVLSMRSGATFSHPY